MERIQVIQDQITEIGDQLEGLGYHERDAPERDDFKEMTTLYNTLVQELSFFEVQPRFDPIEVLPEEVWLAVLKEALTVREHEISYLSVDMALYLTCISSKWRRSIESAPILWTDIILDDAKQDLAMKVSISLIKSGASFLSILIGSPMCCWHDIGSSLIPHKERIRHTYVYSDDLGYSIQHFLLFIIPQLSGSRLQPIKWTHGKDLELGDQLFVHKESKKIHSLSSILLSKAVFSLPEIRNLRDLVTHEDAKRILDITYLLPHLRRVTFLDMTHGYDGGSAEPANNIQSSTAVLPWTSLTYHQRIIGTLASMLDCSSSLLSLELWLLYDQLSEALFHMQEIQSLQRLDIKLWGLPSTEFLPPIIRRPLSNLRELVFRDESRISSQLLDKMLALVSDTFFSLMPNIETLAMTTNQLDLIFDWEFYNGFDKLRTLRIESRSWFTYPCDETSDSNYTLATNIKVLILSYDFTNGLSHINGSDLEYLEMYEFDFSETINGSPIDLHNLGKVQKMRVFLFTSGPTNPQLFGSLTTLMITEPPGNSCSAKFCAHMILYPNTFPALHTVSLAQVPPLDLLFVMLEHRNLGNSSDRAHFKRFSLPVRPGGMVFTWIRDLLRGLVVDRISNVEASDWNMTEVILDRNVSGCVGCHRVRRFCPAAPKDLSPHKEVYSPQLGEEYSTWIYAVSIVQGLTRWEYRSRPRICKRHTGGELVEITEDSLEW